MKGSRAFVVCVVSLVLFNLVGWCHAQEDGGKELLRVKSDLKACRTSLNDLEDEKDQCTEKAAELQRTINNQAEKLGNLEASEQILLASIY